MRTWSIVVMAAVALAACRSSSTAVEVQDPSGTRVADAEVYRNGVLSGKSDSSARFVFSPSLTTSDTLFARLKIDEHRAFRPDHDGWTTRTYLTSRKVENDGSITDFRVTNPIGVQVLKLERNRALIGWHLVVSISWDASEAEFDMFKLRFENASQYLYNLTDGQFLLEQVDIADDGQLWNSAEILFDPDNTRRPAASGLGGFLASPSYTITMFPLEPGGFMSNNPATIIHELGHLAFGLADEYTGILPQPHYCTQVQRSGTDPQFGPNGPGAACMMDRQWVANKLCSRHPDSLHRFGSFQPGPCWETIKSTYEDRAASRRWLITIPDERGAVVGTLPPIVNAWKPTVTRNNRVLTNLCAPFNFTDPGGTSGAGGDVWVQPLSGGRYTLGDLKPNGTILASGVHLGDTIKTTRSIVVVNSSMCTVTQ